MKSTAAETEARVQKVAELLVGGWSRSDLCQYARENWGVSESQADRYAQRARELIRDSRRKDLEDNLAMAEARYEDLYKRAIDAGDLRLALSVTKEQVKLQTATADRRSATNPEDFESFMTCLYTYAEALRSVLPPADLERVVVAVQDLAPVAESLREAEKVEAMLQQCVEDNRELGRPRTREELVEAGFFDGLTLPD